MGIQIREMVIQAKVASEKGVKEKKGDNVEEEKSSEKTVSKLSYSMRKQIVEDCVNEVMDKLNKIRQL